MRISIYKLINNDFYNQFLIIAVLLSTFLLPTFRFTPKMPFIDILDLLLPLLALSFWTERKKINSTYSVFILIFASYVLLTMIINKRLACYRDYFEILKLFKFLLVIIFIFQRVSLHRFHNYLSVVFFAVVIFNIFHYFNIFNFNYFLQHYYYTSDFHIIKFGLNSIGEPATKRMLGTLGNPNNNAILFLFFAAYFLMNKYKANPLNKFMFFLAFTGVVLCQSRTGAISFIFIYVLHFFLAPEKLKTKIIEVLIMGIIFFIVFEYNSSAYIASMSSGDAIMESGSARGRLETWTYLWEMIKDKPFFGHAPFKEYFYTNNLYSESEYVLMTWRYGFIGLLFYLFLVAFPATVAFKLSRKENFSLILVLFTVVLLVSALTNNPLSNPTINITFALLIGISAKAIKQKSIIAYKNHFDNEKTVNRRQ